MQVWTNLIDNALRAVGEAGTLTVEASVVGADAVVTISDTGCGITPELRDTLFELHTTTRGPGAGRPGIDWIADDERASESRIRTVHRYALQSDRHNRTDHHRRYFRLEIDGANSDLRRHGQFNGNHSDRVWNKLHL